LDKVKADVASASGQQQMYFRTTPFTGAGKRFAILHSFGGRG
jgi:hypothetical protein